MAKARARFHRCDQASQVLGAKDEHMIARVYFTLEIEGKTPMELEADIKQTVGAKYEHGPLEVSMPKGYKGEFNYGAFRECAEKYYRGWVGEQGSGIKIGKGVEVTMASNVFVREWTCEFDVSPGDQGW